MFHLVKRVVLAHVLCSTFCSDRNSQANGCRRRAKRQKSSESEFAARLCISPSPVGTTTDSETECEAKGETVRSATAATATLSARRRHFAAELCWRALPQRRRTRNRTTNSRNLARALNCARASLATRRRSQTGLYAPAALCAGGCTRNTLWASQNTRSGLFS